MDRDLWLRSLYLERCPPWPCPICAKGNLAIVTKSLVSHETANSKRLRNHDAWDPDWIAYGFTAWAECKHSQCKQHVGIVGTGSVGPVQDDEGNVEWSDYFVPTYFSPALNIINLPAKCPENVKQELESAFALYWAHNTACAGRIRVALELLLDHLGVKKRGKDKNGKFYDLKLHARVEIYTKANAAAGAQLMALKWLGNSGAHEGTISKEDLLDAFEILEHTLAEIIEQRSKKVATLAKKMIKKHGK